MCKESGCEVTFTGEYRRGNLARHMRRYHKANPRMYFCEVSDCKRSYLRSDARLKHYRRFHPDRVAGPAVPRRPSKLIGHI
jgi:hypothetical protein